AAAIVGIQFERLRAQLAGVVMVGGGAMPGPTIDALGDVAVRYVPLHGMVSNKAQERTLHYAEHVRQNGGKADCAWLTEEELPWAPALFAIGAPLQRFLQQFEGR